MDIRDYSYDFVNGIQYDNWPDNKRTFRTYWILHNLNRHDCNAFHRNIRITRSKLLLFRHTKNKKEIII